MGIYKMTIQRRLQHERSEETDNFSSNGWK